MLSLGSAMYRNEKLLDLAELFVELVDQEMVFEQVVPSWKRDFEIEAQASCL